MGKPAADVLSTFGYELDLDKISIEIGTKRQANKDLRAQSAAIRDGVQKEILEGWMNGFDIWGPGALHGLLEQSLADYAASVLAYYMPGEKRLVVMEKSAQPMAGILPPEAVVVHELVHAWRDEHSGLMRLLTESRPTVEALNIRWCLSEGEAQFATLAWMMQDQGFALKELVRTDDWGLESPLLSLKGAEPAIIPYVYGARFMGKRWEQDGWDGVRGIWENRPTSTEQVLHPRKYRADEPQVVTLPEWPADLPAAERVATECLGEMEIFSMLRAARVGSHEARIAAAGWDGDRLDWYLTESGESAMLWRSVWDRELDARQFYEQIGGRGDGEWRLTGRVVDWVRTQEGKLALVLLEAMSALPHELDGNPDDAISTATLEQEWIDERQSDSFTLEDQVVYPRYDLRLPVPEGWTVQEFRGTHVLHPNLGSGEGVVLVVHEGARYSGMNLEGELEKSLKQFARMGVEVLESDIRQIGGREAGWVRYAGDTAGRAYGWVSIHLDEDRQVLVSLSVQNPELERVEPLVEQVYGGLSFGVGAIEQPEEEPEEDDHSSRFDVAPDPINHFTLRVIDGLTGEVCPNQEVWVASSRAVSESRGALNEKQVLERGRRFQTDSSGSVQIPFRYFAQKVAARKGGSFSFASIYPDHGDVETLRITPQSNLVVRVVDQNGKPVRKVPVAIIEERKWSSHLINEKVTRTRRGEVTWDNVFSQLANRENDKQYSVTFAFPTRNAKGIPIRPGDDLSEPIVLTLPETGSVVLRIDPEDVKGDEFVEYYPSSPDKAQYLPKIEVLGTANGLSYGHIDTPADGEFRKEPYTWVFPFVEVGLELSVVPAYGREPLLISGPVSAGDRVVVPLKVDQIGKKVISYGGWAGTDGDSPWVVHWEGRTSSTIGVTGRCLDADGQPMADTVMDWTVRRGRADKRESHSSKQVTTEADGSFKTRIFLDPGDNCNLMIQLIAVEDLNASQVWSASWSGSDPPDPLSLGDLGPQPDAQPFIPHFSIFVQDEAGEPIEGANCTLISEIGDDLSRPLERGEKHRAMSLQSSSLAGATNAFGKLSFPWLGIHESEPGIILDERTAYVTVRAAGYGDRSRQEIEHGARRVTITLNSY